MTTWSKRLLGVSLLTVCIGAKAEALLGVGDWSFDVKALVVVVEKAQRVYDVTPWVVTCPTVMLFDMQVIQSVDERSSPLIEHAVTWKAEGCGKSWDCMADANIVIPVCTERDKDTSGETAP